MDLNMLVVIGRRERTEAECRALLGAAALNLSRIIATRSEMRIFEAVGK
jgi:hypothetical protein